MAHIEPIRSVYCIETKAPDALGSVEWLYPMANSPTDELSPDSSLTLVIEPSSGKI